MAVTADFQVHVVYRSGSTLVPLSSELVRVCVCLLKKIGVCCDESRGAAGTSG